MKRDQWVQLIPSVMAGLYLAALGTTATADMQPGCPDDTALAVQVLGSGGPIADDARASSGYLVWKDGAARALVDIGGGTVLRFAEAGAAFADLDAVLLTHLHADHSADLPALLKSGVFSGRERSLVLAGPPAGGNDKVSFPSLEDYVTAMLQPDSGAYGYLGGYLDGSDGLPYLRLAMIEEEFEYGDDGDDEDDEGEEGNDEDDEGEEGDDEDEEEIEITRIPLRDSELTITAASVGHGPVPAVAYRIDVAGRSIVFAGDQDGRSDVLAGLAEAVDVLVLHMPIPEDAGPRARALHAVPSRLGEIAADAEAGQVILSHFMARALRNIDANVEALREAYDGPVHLAEDLACLPLD